MISKNYAQEWVSAIERTERFSLNVPPHQITLEKYLTAERQAEFPHVVQCGLGDINFSDVVAQCLAMHYRLAPVIQKWLGCPAIYTLGWVDDGTDKGMFKFDDEFIADKIKNGHAGGSVNVHAWLTLPSMEIIDVTLATSIATIQNIPEGYGRVIAQVADELKGMAYRPMLIGSDFLRRTGILFDF